MSEYISGACNIGPSEIKRRQQGAVIGGVLFLLTAILFISTNATTATRLISFIPAMLFAVGVIQARRKFCVAYGFLGVFSFEKIGATTKVKVNQELVADRKYAVKLLLQSVLAAAVLTALVIII
jgi:hypothetical protein